MNLAWIAGITIFPLTETLLPCRARASRLAGGGAIATGLLLPPIS